MFKEEKGATFFISRVDDNGNGVFDQGETWYDGLAGQIVIEGAGNSFTVTIDTNAMWTIYNGFRMGACNVGHRIWRRYSRIYGSFSLLPGLARKFSKIILNECTSAHT